MKYLVLFVLVFLNISLTDAQQKTIENLRFKLSVTTPDTTKAITLDSLSMYYLFFTNKPDSSFYYANELVNLSFNLKDKKYLILAYARMGFYYVNTSQNKAALDVSLKGIKLSEQYHIPDYLSALYYNISWVFYNLGDPASGLKNGFEAIRNLKDNRDPFYDQPLHIFGLMGNIYLDNSKPDTALYYFKLVDSLASVSKELAARDIANWYLSMYYLQKENYRKADSLISVGIKGCENNGDFLLGFFHLFLAQSYLGQGKVHEAIAAGLRALDISKSLEDKGGANASAFFLKECYDKIGKPDSAYYYLKVGDSLRAVIESKGSANEIQQIRFDDQMGQKEEEARRILQNEKTRNKVMINVFLTAFLSFLIITGIQWNNNKQKRKANALLQKQNETIENTLAELKATQSQLIQSEKMASLGELTAGIAHEIQNPLNFVNNFSEVNTELAEELKTEALKGNKEEVIAIANDIQANAEKINHHGKRADAIVKGMLLHSQSSKGKKEPTDINALADEYFRLSYHGLRAREKSFNATMATDFDQKIGNINMIAQDIGRVLLNLYNNAFYAVSEKKEQLPEGYEPTVSVSTRRVNGKVEIRVRDNGYGIPQKVLDKIFQPFFTTKPTGQGTGLGLSLSYEIVKAHGGEIKVDTREGEFTEFVIQIPVV